MASKTTDPRSRLLLLTGAFYLAILFGIVVIGAIIFSDLYGAPTDALRSAFPANVPVHQNYVTFLTWSGLGLAAYLSIWAAVFGVLRKNFWHGLMALASGGILTISALSALPWIYYPYDQYSAAAAWIFATGVPMILLFATTSLLARYLWKNRKIQMV